MKTANNKPWLSPHGQSLDMAKYVVETYSRLIETDEYRNHTTYLMWIAESEKIIKQHASADH
jgi:hypothetical protein